MRRFGSRSYYGDASRLDVLRAAGAGKAQILVLAIDDVEASLRTAENARKHFPKLKIYARARNRFHAYRLMDIGVDFLMRETFFSSLDLAQNVMQGLGMAEWEARDATDTFRRHDERQLESQHAVYHDETQLIQTSKDAHKELEGIFDADTERGRAAQRERAGVQSERYSMKHSRRASRLEGREPARSSGPIRRSLVPHPHPQASILTLTRSPSPALPAA